MAVGELAVDKLRSCIILVWSTPIFISNVSGLRIVCFIPSYHQYEGVSINCSGVMTLLFIRWISWILDANLIVSCLYK